MESNLCVCSPPQLLSMGPAIECGHYTQCHSLDENGLFLSQQLSFPVASSTEVGLCANFPGGSCARILSGLNL